MLKLYNKEHVAVASLTDLKDYKIEYLLSGEDSLGYSLSICDENINLVEEEGYVRTEFNEYVIKAIDPSQNFKRFNCIVNIEDIKAKSIKNFDTSNNNITDTIRLAIAGTGWILADNNINKRRTVRLKNTDALEVLREVRKVFRVDYRFDAINKIIYVYEQFGSDKGVYFTDELNLKSLQIPSDTYDYTTRIYCYGKEGLNIASINGGKEYIENFQYSNKIIEKIWADDRYTVLESLKEDAIAKLEELSKPKRSYQADILDLAKMSDEYKFLDFFLGDTITLLSKTEKFRDKQRIVKYIDYPKDPSKNTCELGNTTLTFEELQKENEAKNKVVDNTTIGNGIVNGSSIDSIKTEQISDFETSVAKITDLTVINADIVNLKAQTVTITGELNTVKANIGTLNSNLATIDKLTVTHTAQINDLKVSSATITQLNAIYSTIGTIEVEVGKIQTLVNGNLSSENIQAGGITSDKLNIANGFIKNAMIESLDVSKVKAGDISTNKFRIISNDGGIEIVGANQQFKDKNNKVRIQMGKDAQGNFNFIIRGEDGTTTLIDHTGIKAKAIAEDLIVNNMIASDAVGEKQINYSSFANGFNKDTNTTTLKATKIKLDNQNQTLELAFNNLKTQSDGIKSLTESNSTTINVMQGEINTAINNTQIIKDGQTILLKDDYNRTVQTVNSMSSTIGSHTTQINQANGKIENVETKVNTVERGLNSITARVSSNETAVNNVNNVATNNAGNITNLQGEVTTVKSSVASLEVGLQGITQRVSSNESTTVSLTTKVNQVDGKINNAKNEAISSSVGVKDTRNTNENPQWYLTNYPKRSVDEFKTFKILGINTSSAYGVLTTNVPWIDSSGGYPVQTFRSNSGGTYERKGMSNTTWGNWQQIEDTNGSQSKANQALTDAKIYTTTEVTKTNNKVASIETNLNSITSRVSSVESTTTTINGQVSSLTSRISSAEQKITSDAIVSTVKNHQTNGQSTFITGTVFNQTIDNFEFKFFNNTEPNMLRNSSFFKGWTYWGWNGSFEKFIYHDGGFEKGDTVRLEFTAENQGLFQRDIDCTQGVAIKVHVLASRVVDMDIGIEGIYTKRVRMNEGWNEIEVIVPPIPKVGTFIFYTKAGGPHTVYAHKFKIQTGNICTPWSCHREEIYSNTTIIDNEGIEIKHDNGSKSKFTHEAVDFFNSQGRRTLRIKDGGFNFHTWQDPAELVGFIKSSVMPSMNNYNGVTLSTYGLGDYIAIGTSSSQDEESWLNNPNIFIASHGDMGSVTKAGTWFLNEQVYSRTAINAYSGITLNPDAQFPHRIYNSVENKLCVFGDNHTTLGIKYGNENRTAIEITEDEGQVSKTYIHTWGDWDFHNYTIRNVRVSGTLQAQSSMLRSFFMVMPSQVNDTYNVMSMTDGELRYTQRKAEHITNKTLIVELPHVISENIELDYHVNISKLSWGDYKIVEKTPYYFEIETNVDDFSFTYEIVAKMIEKPDSYTSIASAQYGSSEEDIQEKGNDTIQIIK